MLVLLLSVIVLSIQVQTPLPTVKTEKPVVKNKTAHQNKGTVTNQKNAQHGSGIAVGTTESAVHATHKEDNHQDETQGGIYLIHEVSPPEAKHAPPLFVPYLIATIFGVAVNAFVLILIWKQTRINGQQARINLITAKAAIRSASAAKASADALISSERAWVMVDVELYSIRGDGLKYETTKVDMRLTYTNVGKTPAWITEKSIRFALVDTTPDPPDFDSITPFQSRPQWLQTSYSEERDLEHEGYQLQHAGNLRIIYGRIKYRDIFGKERMTTFGYDIDLNDEAKRIGEPAAYNENT